jgi:hypothetical protein
MQLDTLLQCAYSRQRPRVAIPLLCRDPIRAEANRAYKRIGWRHTGNLLSRPALSVIA